MENKTTSISVIDAIGTPNAILHSFGMKVYDTAKAAVQENKPVVIDFHGVRNLTSAFLHASIGNLVSVSPSPNLVQFTGLDNQHWEEKLQEAIKLATDPKQQEVIESALDTLYED